MREEGEMKLKVDLKPDPGRIFSHESMRDLTLNVHESIQEQLYLKAKRFKKV